MLLDTQFLTGHLARFGAAEIPREQYLRKLQDALNHEAIWPFAHLRHRHPRPLAGRSKQRCLCPAPSGSA